MESRWHYVSQITRSGRTTNLSVAVWADIPIETCNRLESITLVLPDGTVINDTMQIGTIWGYSAYYNETAYYGAFTFYNVTPITAGIAKVIVRDLGELNYLGNGTWPNTTTNKTITLLIPVYPAKTTIHVAAIPNAPLYQYVSNLINVTCYYAYPTNSYANVNYIVGYWKDTDGKISQAFLKFNPNGHNGFSPGDEIKAIYEG